MLKENFEKAYDNVNWDFFMYMLGRLGCAKWIRRYLESSSISILVNGSSMDQFVPTKGLRQGTVSLYFYFL